MANEAELHATIARLEAALGALSTALDARGASDEQAEMLNAAAVELETARAEAKEAQAARLTAEQRVMTLEQEAKDREAALSAALEKAATPEPAPESDESIRLRAALEALSASSDQLRAQADGAVDASLKAELDALRAARAMDLAEMRAILTELEPMMESA